MKRSTLAFLVLLLLPQCAGPHTAKPIGASQDALGAQKLAQAAPHKNVPFQAPPPMPSSEADCHHPMDARGNLVHDWMMGGDGVWRCWYCDMIRRP
jgi:hypothetical protein